MKKVLFATLCIACFAATGLYGQKGNASGNSEVSTQGSNSHARQGKNVGKGSPLLQRQAGSTSEQADDAPADAEAAPGSPAPSKSQASPTRAASPAPADQKGTAPAEKKNTTPAIAPATKTGESAK